jgi:hypothetical protein
MIRALATTWYKRHQDFTSSVAKYLKGKNQLTGTLQTGALK